MTDNCILSIVIAALITSVASKPLDQIFGEVDDLQQYSWEPIDLQILSKSTTPPKDETDKSPDFYVIIARFPGEGTYIFHLNKPQGLFYPQQLILSDEDDQTDLQCLYEGTAHKVIRNGVHVDGGTLSLSSCSHQDYSGFEGLLLFHDNQYYIKPDLEIINHDNSNVDSHLPNPNTNLSDTQAIKHSHKPSTRHRAYKISNSTQPIFNIGLDETLRVPPQDLQKWAQNQSVNYDKLLDEDSMMQSPVIFESRDNKFHTRNKNILGITPTNVTTSPQVVEIAVFTDAKLYNKWSSSFPKNTTGKLKQYILAVVNNMNALYKQPSMTEKISFRLVNIEIATSQPKNLNDNNGEAVKFLRSFCTYAAEKNLEGTLWDHALLLTGADLSENGNNITSGIAWYSTMCVNGLSCSVVEGNSFSSAFVSTHEVGHSLGMDHDGSALNLDCNANSSIMSPTTGGGKISWSKCSMRNMKQFLDRGYLGVNPPKCLFKKSSKQGGGIKYSGSKMPGQQFPAKVQCSSFCGSKCSPYVTKKSPYNNVCFLLHCQHKQGQYTIVESIHPALEGTPCAKGKVCRLGKCQKL